LADQFAIQKAEKDTNSFSGILFSVLLERAESVDPIIVLQMTACIRTYPLLLSSSSAELRARIGSEDGGGGELALPAAEPTMRPRIYPRIFWRYSSAGK
jgi:hypothetical protein